LRKGRGAVASNGRGIARRRAGLRGAFACLAARRPALHRPIIRAVVAALPRPDPAVLRDAMAGEASPGRHDRAAERIPALRLIELRQPDGPPAPAPATLRVAAWNLERCTQVEASAAVLRRAGVAVALLSEMDLGMARSGNRHTTHDIAGALGAGAPGAGYAFGVEYVELGLGIGRELVDHAGRSNAESLHGNAVVSALPFRDPFMVPLDPGGAWFDLDWHHRRIGGRMAFGVTVELARGPVVLVSTHLENRSTPEDRRRHMERILAGLEASAPGLPAVVAGDLNTAAMPDLSAEPGLGWFEAPARREPLFAAMAAAGFDWRPANTPEQTRRHIADGRPAPRAARIDWLFTRGLAASAPRTWPAVDDAGTPLSDHELITVDIA